MHHQACSTFLADLGQDSTVAPLFSPQLLTHYLISPNKDANAAEQEPICIVNPLSFVETEAMS
jgi:hypothetical protein